MHPSPGVRLIALTLLLAALTAVMQQYNRGSARAEGGVPIPAPAGTKWSIIAGYNTVTHS